MESTQKCSENRGGRQYESRGRELTDQVRDAAQQAGQQLRSGAKAVGEQARDTAAEVGQGLKKQGQQMLDERKGMATEKINHLSNAIRGTAQKLHDDNDPNLASYVEAAAEKVEGASRYLQDRSVADVLKDVRGVARRHPGLFFGGMFIAGFALARFLKASEEDGQQEEIGGEASQGSSSADGAAMAEGMGQPASTDNSGVNSAMPA